MKKIVVTSICWLSLLFSVSFASESKTNAKIVFYAFHEHSYSLLIPDNISNYEHLGHYPLTAFLFVNHFSEKKIDQLKVNDLKKGYLGRYYEAVKLDKIKGFEKTANLIKEIDEFGISSKKTEIISNLKVCYRKYVLEYNKYLRGENGLYKFRKGEVSWRKRKKLKEYSNRIEIYPQYKLNYEVKKSDYNFDNKTLTISVLLPYSNPHTLFRTHWEYIYVNNYIKFRRKYKNRPDIRRIKFPEKIKVIIPFDDARKIFSDKDKTYCETILTVRPINGFLKRQTGTTGTTGTYSSIFLIEKVTKNFYKGKNWSEPDKKFIGGPVLTLNLDTKKYVFY